ncbi:hypothetical protein EPO33_02335 [Patescibacteria group bacterium]|nr:MAG: hypothetical protein EPO33_02335 [Patescibacteria group bacterium]
MKKLIIIISALAFIVAAAAMLVWAAMSFFRFPSLEESMRKTAMEDPVGVIFSQYLDSFPSWAVSACRLPNDYCGGYPSCRVYVPVTTAVGRTGGPATEGTISLLNGRSIASSTFVVIGDNAYARCGRGPWQASQVTPSSTGPVAWASLIRNAAARDELVDLFVKSRIIRTTGIPKRTFYYGDDEWRIPVRIDQAALRSFLGVVGFSEELPPASPNMFEGSAYVNPFSFRIDHLVFGPVEPHEGARIQMTFSARVDQVVPPGVFLSNERLRPSSAATGGRITASSSTVSGLTLAGGSATSTPQGDDTDQDNDGLPDVLEGFYGSDPRNPDTDGDGVMDGAEVDAGRDPLGPGLLYDFRAS